MREIITQMMRNYRLSWSKITGRIGIMPVEVEIATGYNGAKSHEMEADGLILLSNDVVAMTSIGSLLARNVVVTFSPLVQRADKKFSKPV